MKDGQTTNQWGLKVLAFVIACFLWLFVVNISEPVVTRTFRDVPVEVTNQDILSKSSKTYSVDEDEEKVTVQITGKRQIIDQITKSDISATADMSELGIGGEEEIPLIPITITVKDYNDEIDSAKATPQNLEVTLEDEMTKTFPITAAAIDGEKVADGYALGTMTVTPDTVSIRGAKSRVEAIAKVVAHVSVDGLTEDTALKSNIELYDSNNNQIEDTNLSTGTVGTDGVRVDVEVLPTKTIDIKYDASSIKTASGYYVADVVAEPTTIVVAGDPDTLQKVDEVIIPARALASYNLRDKEEKTVDITPYINELGLTLADTEANSVAFTINVSKNGSRTFDISLGSINVKNFSSNYTMKYTSSDAISVQVQGPQTTLNSMDLSDALSIDLSSCTKEGTYTVPVKVALPDNCSLVKDVKVTVKIVKKG